MKKFTNVLLTMSCLFLSTFMLAGCGKDGEAGANGMEPVHAALILQPISTAPVVNRMPSTRLICVYYCCRWGTVGVCFGGAG